MIAARHLESRSRTAKSMRLRGAPRPNVKLPPSKQTERRRQQAPDNLTRCKRLRQHDTPSRVSPTRSRSSSSGATRPFTRRAYCAHRASPFGLCRTRYRRSPARSFHLTNSVRSITISSSIMPNRARRSASRRSSTATYSTAMANRSPTRSSRYGRPMPADATATATTPISRRSTRISVAAVGC